MAKRDSKKIDKQDRNEATFVEDKVTENNRIQAKKLIDQLVVDKKISTTEAAKSVYKSALKGKIKLVDPHPPTDPLRYLFSSYSLWFWVVFIIISTLFSSTFILPQTYPFTSLKNVIGLLFLTYVIGYTFIEMVYPNQRDFDRIERFTLGVVLSISLVPIIGLILNYTPWGMSAESSLIVLSLFTITSGLIGVYRKYLNWIQLKK